jgi:hypothetical protein
MRLKVIQHHDIFQVEKLTNEFIDSGEVWSVISLKVYPTTVNRVGYEPTQSWICYIIYKCKFADKQ